MNIKTWAERAESLSDDTVVTSLHLAQFKQSEIDELSAELSLVNVDLEITKLGAAKTMQEFMRENRKLREAAQAVIDRWDTPHWKDVPATAEYIGRLRAALGEKS